MQKAVDQINLYGENKGASFFGFSLLRGAYQSGKVSNGPPIHAMTTSRVQPVEASLKETAVQVMQCLELHPEIIGGGLDRAQSQPYDPGLVGTTLFQGCHFTFKVQGVGEPVVFIQGVGLHGDGWRPQTDALRRLFYCLSFDNRGMAFSQPSSVPITVPQMAADTLAIMDAARIRSAHVVGHSLGGCVAQQIALSQPDRVKSLALLCTSARGATLPLFRRKWHGSAHAPHWHRSYASSCISRYSRFSSVRGYKRPRPHSRGSGPSLGTILAKPLRS